MTDSGGASRVGKTLLPGHALRDEGIRWWHESGTFCQPQRCCGWEHVGRCECGALSPTGLSQSGVKRWHRAHKDAVRDPSQGLLP